MNFKFEINKGLLIYSALLGNKRTNFNSPDIKNELYKNYVEAHMLFWEPRKIFLHDDYQKSIYTATKNLEDMFSYFEKTNEYISLFDKTLEYKKWIETEWKSKKEIVTNSLREILKVEIPMTTAKVYLVEPSIGGGMYLGNNKIYWGHREDWPNYNIVYLTHEYMHTFFPVGELEHAVIELAVDNELRIRLNNKGEYFKTNGELVGHQSLRTLEKKLLQNWEKYLIDKNMDIYKFIKQEKTRGDNPF